MSNPSISAKTSKPELWNERLDPWGAALLTALLHLLMLLLLLQSKPPLVTSAQEASGGGRVKVDFVGQTPPSPQVAVTPTPPKPQQTPKPRPKPAARRQADDRKPVLEAKYIEPPAEPEQAQAATETPPATEATQPPAASPPATTPRRSQAWTGRPPGFIDKQTNADNDGRAFAQGNRSGNQNARAPGGPAMEIGGFQIVYDLLSERRLRAWMDQGMEEISFPLPGTRHLMVCPAEVALRRGSSKCRLLAPDSPELKNIGDARETVTVMYVYRYGEMLWRGPGPYR